jgi:periplasmic protein CpxP/Spy
MTRETTLTAAADPSARRRTQWVMIGMLMTLLAAIGVSAWAQTPPPAPGMNGAPGMHRGGMRGGGMHDGMGMGPGMMFHGSPERIGRMVDFMLDGLHASDAQRTQIKQIAVQAAGDLKTQATSGKAARQRSLQLFTAPTIDAAAIEQARQQMLQQHDQMSRRVTQALIDVANVLTPEQRATMGARIRDRQARIEDRMQRMQHDAPHR